jgi:hypothetical protein
VLFMTRALAAFALLSLACDAADSGATRDELVLRLDPSGALAVGEAYVCLGFGTAELAGAAIRRVHWSVPGGVHHATLFATGAERPAVGSCDEMPADAITIHVWTPGGQDLDLGADTGYLLPATHDHLLIELHLVSVAQAAAVVPTLGITRHLTLPAHRAAWNGLVAPVPAIRPHHQETSTATCRLAGAAHLVMTWPHMHATGRAFLGAAVTEAGRVRLVEIADWNVAVQEAHPLDLDLPAGTAIETTCVWENRTDDYVLPGVRSTDEMCVQGLIGYPAEAMRCAPVEAGAGSK